MASFSIEQFKTEISKVGVARPNRFEMLIHLPLSLSNYLNTGRTVSLLCDSSSIPLINIFTKQHLIYGPAYPRPITAEYGGEGIIATFYVDREMVVKKFFDAWMFSIVNPETFNVAYQNDYISEITINQLDEQDNVTYSVILEEAFPRSIDPIIVSQEAMNQVHKLTVQFTYRKWRTNTILSNNKPTPMVQNPNSPFGTNTQRRLDLK